MKIDLLVIFDFELDLEYTSSTNFYFKYLTLDCEIF